MNTSWLDIGVRKAAIVSISGYQKYLSPHKGFSCAYRLLHGTESCSQYVKRMVAQQSLAAAIKASKRRFQDCREANQILRARINNSELEPGENNNNKRRKNTYNPNNCQLSGTDPICCDCGIQSLDCASSLPSELPNCDLPDCGHCASSADCGALDCGSGLDCGVLDCGSCG